jgi:hypothetical protein
MRTALLGCLVIALLSPGGIAQDETVPVRPKLVTSDTQRAIEDGLKFLARERHKDGYWRASGGSGEYPVAMTGLAGLAIIASGSTPTRGPHAKDVRMAVRYVLSQQQPNGLFAATSEEPRSMYGHGFGMLFLAQAYGMEEDTKRQREIARRLQKGIELTARSQSRDGGWLYTPNSMGDEGSVTVTQIQALRACRNAGLHVPKATIDRAISYIERSQNPDGGISYSVRQRGSRPAISAAACAVLYNAGAYDSPMAEKCFKYTWKTCKPRSSHGHYFYTQLYMSQAVWQKGDKYWKEYYPKIRQQMLALQQGNGSWKGDGVGTTYGTAIALLILQLPYNHLPILSR